MRKQVLVAMTVVTLGGASWALAEPEAPRRPRRGMSDALALTDQQRADVGRLRSEERKGAIRRRADMAIARQELRELLTAPTLNEEAVSAKIRQVSALHAAAVQARADQLLAMRRVLTPEQLERLAQLPPQRPRRHPRRPPREPLTGPEGE